MRPARGAPHGVVIGVDNVNEPRRDDWGLRATFSRMERILLVSVAEGRWRRLENQQQGIEKSGFAGRRDMPYTSDTWTCLIVRARVRESNRSDSR